jgi:hypothetical protein
VRIDSLDETPTSTPTPAPSSAPAPAEPASTPEQPATSSEDSGKTRRILSFAAMGAGVVGLGVGTVFGFLAKSKLDSSNNGSPAPCNKSDQCTTEGLSDRKDAGSFATISTIGFIAGGVLAAGGVVLFLTAPPAPTTTGLTLSPAPLTGGAGALLSGSF